MQQQDRKLTRLQTHKLQCAYLPLAKYQESVIQWQDRMLGAICFSARSSPTAFEGHAPLVHVPMPALGDDGSLLPVCEIWGSDASFSYGERNGVRYGCNEHLLFGVIQLNEDEFSLADGRSPLQLASERAYAQIFELADTLAFPHILRFWNYMADINGESHGMERYRQFNMGRQEGFLQRGRHVVGSVPAASAVGFEHGPLTVYFLAGRGAAPTVIENPRQVSAYDYPSEYGPRSPTFSRASVCTVGDDHVLFLSGTASIVGHRTLHQGDVAAQTRETLANIEAMVAEANRVEPQAEFTAADLCYKVYVRYPQDVALIDSELRRILGPATRRMFIRADICRGDLLMEIEATAGHPLELAF